jgi:hypothetical protein
MGKLKVTDSSCDQICGSRFIIFGKGGPFQSQIELSNKYSMHGCGVATCSTGCLINLLTLIEIG